MTDKFTLIIPTYNRSHYLKNLIHYLEKNEVGFPVEILDSSDDENFKINEKRVEASTIRISIHKYAKKIPFKKKLLDGLEKIQTEFCAFCADDDIMLYDALLKSIEFLEENPDYVCAQGLYFSFIHDKKNFFIDDILYNSPSLNQDDKILRFDALFKDYQSNFYGVYRTDTQKKVFRVISDIENSLYFELLQSVLPLMLGKVKRLPLIYSGRQRSPQAERMTQWHPVEWFSAEPDSYYEKFLDYQKLILAFVEQNETDFNAEQKAAFSKIIHLVHMNYTFNSYAAGNLAVAIDSHLKKGDREKIVSNAFSAAYAPQNLPGLPSESLRFRIVRKIYRMLVKPVMGKCLKKFLMKDYSSKSEVQQDDSFKVEMNAGVKEKVSAFGDETFTDQHVKVIFNALKSYGNA